MCIFFTKKSVVIIIKLEWFLWNYDEENTSRLKFPCTTNMKLSMQNAQFQEEISRNAFISIQFSSEVIFNLYFYTDPGSISAKTILSPTVPWQDILSYQVAIISDTQSALYYTYDQLRDKLVSRYQRTCDGFVSRFFHGQLLGNYTGRLVGIAQSVDRKVRRFPAFFLFVQLR